MARQNQRDHEPITIVGGRPMHRAVDVTQLPTGIEQALTLAALDFAFRERFAHDPVGAALSKGIKLQDAERALLEHTPPQALRAMAEQIVMPRTMSRRQFVKPVAASIVAMITGSAFLLCSGCTGADSWQDPDASAEGGANQLWMNLAGHTCYVYLCPKSVQSHSWAAPVIVALHDQGETCLSNVLRWRTAADSYNFNVVSVNWTEEPADQASLDKLATDLRAIATEFAQTYAAATGQQHLCSRGASTPIVWKAGFEHDPNAWGSAVFLGGMPAGDWTGAPDTALLNLVSPPPSLYHVIGTTDPELAAAQAMAAALTAKGATVKLQQVDGSTATAVLDFSSIWGWMTSHA
jgi:hypothetical protein